MYLVHITWHPKDQSQGFFLYSLSIFFWLFKIFVAKDIECMHVIIHSVNMLENLDSDRDFLLSK